MGNLHFTTRIPVWDNYAAALGKAVYVFAYYEWTVIYIIDHLRSNYVQTYSRPPLDKNGNATGYTSGKVNNDLKSAILETEVPLSPSLRDDLSNCQAAFSLLYIRRNALIHAHPITFNDKQILGYQTTKTAKISTSDMIWELSDIESFIRDIDEAAIAAGTLLETLNKII